MTDFAQTILIGVATPVLVAVLFWMYRNWMKPFAAFVRALGDLVTDVGFIKSELQSNGGGSLKDSVKRIDEKLTLMEGRQRGLIAVLPRATFETDGKFNWIDCNVSLERLTGVGFQNLARRRWVSLIDGDDRAQVMEEITHAVQDKRNVDISFRLMNGAGDAVSVRMEASPILSRPPDEQIICWTGSLVKVDDRRVEERRGI